jgi:lipopolysaccharide assembly outer membrane protein LptD (OstA)
MRVEMHQNYISRVLLLIVLLLGVGWTDQAMEIIAPGGGDLDLEKNIMKYYAAGANPVVVRWEDYVLETAFLEYNRNQAIIKGKKRVKLTLTKPVSRVLKCDEINLDLKHEAYSASQNVRLDYDRDTIITGEKLNWDQARGKMLLSGQPVIYYQDWKISGKTVEGRLVEGLFTINGGVCALNQDVTIRAGKLTFNRQTGLYTLEDHPVLLKGANEVTATAIIYNIKTKTVSAQGEVKSRLIKEKQ